LDAGRRQADGSRSICLIVDTARLESLRRAMSRVTAPIQLWSSTHGGDGATLQAVTALGHPNKPDFHVVPSAGHFAFLAPCSSEQMKVAPRFCVDASDFDRATFHKEFDATVLGFFRQYLGERSK
jgi:hypothetical protein